MNNNYVLLGLSVLAVASIYLFWLNYKQTQEMRGLYMRLGNVGGMNPEIQEDLSSKFNKFDGDLDKLKQYVFGELLPRLEKQHHVTQQKLQELQYHTGLVELPTEVDNSPTENVSDVEGSVSASDQYIEDLDMEEVDKLNMEDLEDMDGLNLEDLEDLNKTADDNLYDSDNSDNSGGIDVDDLADMKSVEFNNTETVNLSSDDTHVTDTTETVTDTTETDKAPVELDSKTLCELKTMARELGIKPKGNKNDLIKTLLGKVEKN